jgi:hypothetical protein
MTREPEAYRYTGMRPMAPMPLANYWGMHNLPPGHCRQCGQPSSCCCCGCRECRKEAKELLVTPGATGQQEASARSAVGAFIRALLSDVDATAPGGQLGTGQAFIGGGCCVSVSVEYTPSSPTVQATVAMTVQDSEGTALAWGRVEQPGAGYRVKEGVITTNPGATLKVGVSNATARVRWCEIFSC